MHQTNPLFWLLPLLALIGWRIYRRVRSHIGPQPVRPQRMRLRSVVLGGVALLLLLLPHTPWPARAAELAGLAAGAALAAVSLRLTRFEHTAAGSVYTPNLYFGVGISLLLVGRVLYRLAQVYQFEQAAAAGAAHPPAPMAMPQTPATLALLGVFLGYYIAYNAGVLRHGSKLSASGAAQ